MAYVQFYIGDPNEYLKDRVYDTIRNIHSIQILESPSANTGFSVIDTIKFNPTSRYIESSNASEELIYRFYKLQFIQDPALYTAEEQVILTSSLIYPEIMSNIVDDVREQIGDTDLDDPAFSDVEYIEAIRFALLQWKGQNNINRIEAVDKPPIVVLVIEHFAIKIMNDHAKYYQLKSPSVELNKWQIGEHYSTVIQTCQQQLDKYAKRLNKENGGYDDDMIISQMPSAKVETVTRFSKTRGISITGRNKYFPTRRNLSPDYLP